MGNFKMFLVVLEELVGLSSNVPGTRGWTILRTINQLAFGEIKIMTVLFSNKPKKIWDRKRVYFKHNR